MLNLKRNNMLYLIRDRDYIKIGYTSNLDQRQKAYETTNCYAEVIMTKDGTRKDESNLHKLCDKWHYKNEWFYYDDEIVKIFEEYQPDQEERIKKLEAEVSTLKIQMQSIINYINKNIKELEEWNNAWVEIDNDMKEYLSQLK